MSTHTPTPWKTDGVVVFPEPGNVVAATVHRGHSFYNSKVVDWDEQTANAAFICKAVNAHDDLLAALRMFLSLDPRCHRGVEHCGECAACLGREAIARAEGTRS